MKKYSLLPLFLLFISFAKNASAQTEDSTKKEQPHVKISVNHNSGLHYYGRTDSLKSKGLFPLVELWLTSKLYVNAAPVFVYNKYQSLDYAGSVATLGYLDVSDKWISNFYILKPIYKESSGLVQSALKVQSGASFTFLNKFLNLTLGGDTKYSNQFDYGATAGVDHIFRKELKNKSVLIVDPGFTVNAGTQNFSRTYTKKTGGILPRQQSVTEQVQAFDILSLEASMPVVYSVRKLQLIATPAFVMPKNLLRTAGQQETGKNMLYTTLTAKYTL